ncbi:MAG: hypothetical protein BGP06_17230 [Rhizobiales bacterium 65-9]|nr:MAG: hypothetical protein BGP06_17230 [Rhizobiales bacterium 65-9]
MTGVRAEPLVQAIFDLYPGAEIVAIRDVAADAANVPPPPVERDPDDDRGDDLDDDIVNDYTEDDL